MIICSVCNDFLVSSVSKRKVASNHMFRQFALFFSSDSLLEKIRSTEQNDKMLIQCFMMLFSGQEPNLLRHTAQAMTKCPWY